MTLKNGYILGIIQSIEMGRSHRHNLQKPCDCIKRTSVDAECLESIYKKTNVICSYAASAVHVCL